MFVLLSAQDVVGGTRINIVRTDGEEIYYFGLYDGQANIYVTPLFGSLYPRDLMAKTLLGQGSFGAVSLGCDNNEISVTNGDAETAGNIYVADTSSISLHQNLVAKYVISTNHSLPRNSIRIWWGGGPSVVSTQPTGVFCLWMCTNISFYWDNLCVPQTNFYL